MSHSCLGRGIPVLLCLAWLMLIPASSHAQHIQGSLLDMQDDQPIAGASVSLIDAAEEVVQQVVTDNAGRFRVSFPGSGRYMLKAERIGYMETTSPPLDLLGTDTLVVELHMSAEAVSLAPLTVQVAPRRTLRSRILDGFYHRQSRGWGTHYGPEYIDRFRPARVTNLLQNTPGMRLRYSGLRTFVRMRSGGGECNPTIFIDGHRAPGVEIDQWVSSSSLRAMEVYNRGLQVPGEFASKLGNPDCGAIVIWTSMSLGG